MKFEKTDVDRVLAQAQQQDALLVRLEKEMERNKEYLTKVCPRRANAVGTDGISCSATLLLTFWDGRDGC